MCPSYCSLDCSLPRSSLLQPTNYVLSQNSSEYRSNAVPHTQDDIRSYTMQLSGMAMSPKSTTHSIPPSTSPAPESAFIFPSGRLTHETAMKSTISLTSQVSSHDSVSIDLTSSMTSHETGNTTPRGAARSPTTNPSGLSLLLSGQRTQPYGASPSSYDSSGAATPVARQNIIPEPSRHRPLTIDLSPSQQKSTPFMRLPSENVTEATETSALLGDIEAPGQFYTTNASSDPPYKSNFSTKRLLSYVQFDAKDVLATAIRSMPAVVLGVLLNILDGISCKRSNEYHRHNT